MNTANMSPKSFNKYFSILVERKLIESYIDNKARKLYRPKQGGKDFYKNLKEAHEIIRGKASSKSE